MKVRCERIGTTLSSVAREVGVDPSTALRGAAGLHETRRSIERKIDEAVTRREIDLRDYLVGLHGLPQAVDGRDAPGHDAAVPTAGASA